MTNNLVLSSIFIVLFENSLTKSIDAINRSFVYILRQKSSPGDLMNMQVCSLENE